MVIELNRNNYESEVLKYKGVVLVDFWGPRCPVCLGLMPVVEQIEKENAGKLKVAKVNSSENLMLCVQLKVMGFPAFIIYRDGIENMRLTGQDITSGQIKAAVKKIFS